MVKKIIRRWLDNKADEELQRMLSKIPIIVTFIAVAVCIIYLGGAIISALTGAWLLAFAFSFGVILMAPIARFAFRMYKDQDRMA